jgi:hypothetical protein
MGKAKKILKVTGLRGLVFLGEHTSALGNIEGQLINILRIRGDGNTTSKCFPNCCFYPLDTWAYPKNLAKRIEKLILSS